LAAISLFFFQAKYNEEESEHLLIIVPDPGVEIVSGASTSTLSYSLPNVSTVFIRIGR
jgi:hypothetical protein